MKAEPLYVTHTHIHGFRYNQPGLAIGLSWVTPSGEGQLPRPCIVQQFEDGTVDYMPPADLEYYKFGPGKEEVQ